MTTTDEEQIRALAKSHGDAHYFSMQACSKGHTGARYVSTKRCVECNRLRVSKWAANNQERRRTNMHRWRQMPEPTRDRPRLCELCGGEPTGRGDVLHLDHDHDTGAFRGWLCSRCNTAIGMLGDTAAGVQKALDYLERYAVLYSSQPQKEV